jgi:GT2 family glycosyltransferase
MDRCHYSFVVLSHNRREKLSLTIGRLSTLRSSFPYEVIVVDNASSDGSLAMLQNYAGIKLIALDKNVGISGWNEGLKAAGGKWIIVLDDDSLPLDDDILNVFAEQESRLSANVGICAFNVFWDKEAKDSWSSDWLEHSLTFIGCGAALRREMVETIGGFDPRIFVYAHEFEYSLNAFQHGFEIVYMPEVRIWHNSNKRTRFDDFWMYHTTWSTLYGYLKWTPMPFLVKGILLSSYLYLISAFRTHTLRAWGKAHLALIRSFSSIITTRTPLDRDLHRRLSKQWLDAKPRSFWMRLLLSGIWVT